MEKTYSLKVKRDFLERKIEYLEAFKKQLRSIVDLDEKFEFWLNYNINVMVYESNCIESNLILEALSFVGLEDGDFMDAYEIIKKVEPFCSKEKIKTLKQEFVSRNVNKIIYRDIVEECL